MGKHTCSVCGYVYETASGIPEKGIAPGTPWESVPADFVCPLCSAPKSAFVPFQTPAPASAPAAGAAAVHGGDLGALSAAELSAICSNLAKGCEKQLLHEEMAAFEQIADYYRAQTAPETGKTLEDAAAMLDRDLAQHFPAATRAANLDKDRGTLRALVWGEKVSIMTQALLARFFKEGEAMMAGTGIWVCDICGFIYVGDTPPEICPVCKVPQFKIHPVERR